MNKQNQLTIRMLRGVMLLMTLLLVPIGAWAEDYDLTVAGVQVTDANALNVLGDQETPTVVFDAASNTLTLSGAEINGEITYNGTSDLTIAFSGTNAVSTSETSAIQYGGSESDRAKLTFSSTNGTLTINGESIGGFSDVDFGSLNLASIYAQGVYYDTDGFLMRGHGTTPSDLTITTETYYPIWIYDPSLSNTGYSHTQLRGESAITIGDGTVSFDGNHTITISNINFNYEGNTLIVVSPSMTELTVNLVGQSTATSGCTVLSLWDTTPLTFTTNANTPGSLTGYDIVSWNGSGNEQISYENGLRAFYDVENPNKETISTTGTYIKIGDTSFSETENVTFGEGTAYFNASSNTLTLTDATIGEQGAETGTDIQVLVDDLTIEISGTNTIYGNIMYNGSNYRSSNIQINKASSAGSASLTATNVNGFSGCTWGDGLYLSAHDGQGATIDVHYEHFEGEGGTMQSYYSEKIADVTFSTEETNAIWVAGTQVTSTNAGNIFAGDETNDGKVSYDFDTHTLTLDGASLYTNENYPSPMIISQGALNVLLKGGSYISFNGNYSTYVFKNTGSSGALTISASDSEASLGVTSEFYDGDYKGLCDGFSTVTFNNDLGLFNKAGTKKIENITGHAPSFYVDNGTSYWQTNKGLLLNATYYYKIDYVDDTIEGSGEEVSLATDETNWGFGGASLDISNLAGPCTITAYAKLNGNTIGSNKAKLFTSNPSPFRLVYGADPVDLVLAPAIEEDDGISINGIEANVTYNSETGKISSETLGSFGGPVAMSSEGTAILNNYFTMNFEVVPPAPTIGLAEGEHFSSETVTITSTIDGATIKYKWNDGATQTYTEAIPVQDGTLKAWVELVYDEATGATVSSDETTATYTLSYALDVAFVGSNSWASYYATENLNTPEGLTAYIVSDVNETTGVVTVQSVSYIPADNGVLLQRADGGDADGYVAAPYTGTTSTFTNLLGGSTNATNISSFNDTPVYVLYNDKFKRATSGTIPARRAYLPLAVASAGAPQLMTLNVVDGDITAIRTLAADDNDGNWYTLDGFKLSGKPQHKGLYIKNGKKVFFNNK